MRIVGPKLNAQGIKVVLSILNGKDVGWSMLTEEDNKHLVNQIGMFMKEYNFDGIDIDDEFGPVDKDGYSPLAHPQKLYATVPAIPYHPLLTNMVSFTPIY